MEKILFVIPYIPYPLTTGGNQAFFNMVDFIRHKFSTSILLCPRNDEEKSNLAELRKRWSNVNFFVFEKSKSSDVVDTPKVRHAFYYKWLGKLKASVERKMRRQIIETSNLNIWKDKDMVRDKSTLSGSVFRDFDEDYLEYVINIFKLDFSIIQIEFYELIALGYLIPDKVQSIFVHHELRYVHNENEMSLFQRVTSKDRLQFHVAKDFERSALKCYKHIITLTDVDRKLLIDFLGNKKCIYTSPAVVRLTNSSKDFIPCLDHRLTFVGSEEHCPNVDGIAWLCNKVVPILRKNGFRFYLQIVGKWESDYAKALAASCPEIQLMGYIEDLSSFLNASIAIVPIRIGSGMRMKILDAVSSNVPVVTTVKGVEGIDFRNGKECMIADGATSFANAIMQLCDNITLQKDLAWNAKEKLNEFYAPQQMFERRLAIYSCILKTDHQF